MTMASSSAFLVDRLVCFAMNLGIPVPHKHSPLGKKRPRPDGSDNSLLSNQQVTTVACRRRGHSRTKTWSLRATLFALFLFGKHAAAADSSSSFRPASPESVALDEDSVVLITGAATFLGSEVALALQRTHRPRKVVLVDALNHYDTVAEMEGSPLSADTENDALTALEAKRERLFRVLQEPFALERQRGNDATTTAAHMFRVDLRPGIYEFYDTAAVPVLDYLLTQHSDITHVVHLAESDRAEATLLSPSQATVAKNTPSIIPRNVEDGPRAGLMEALLDELVKHANQTGRAMPHFVYASSIDVYPREPPSTTTTSANAHVWKESFVSTGGTMATPSSTPSSWMGAARLLDEMLAQTYYDLHGVYSVGLRFAEVYGPSHTPGKTMFSLADRAIRMGMDGSSGATDWKDVYSDQELDQLQYDLLYIDDAVDAVLSAMQFRPNLPDGQASSSPSPVAFNVASGRTVSLRDVLQYIKAHVPSAHLPPASVHALEKQGISTKRAEDWMGFVPRVSLEQGMKHTLAWHYDRSNPNGQDDKNGASSIFSSLVCAGLAGCDIYDHECWRGVPVYPCASDCARPGTPQRKECHGTYWDDVLDAVRSWTARCEAVLYTVDLDENLSAIPSSHVQVNPDSTPHFEGQCNVAFVSDQSPLVQRLRNGWLTGRHLKEGYWTVFPVTISEYAGEMPQLQLIPKLSPGNFFAPSVKVAIYAEPYVTFDNIHNVLRELEMRPLHDEVKTATALVIGKMPPPQSGGILGRFKLGRNEAQSQAYRMFHIKALTDHLPADSDGFARPVDASFVVHRLHNLDSKSLRCDVLGEVLLWNSHTDESAWSFMMGLHDFWNQVVERSQHEQGADDKTKTVSPWWHGDDVITIHALNDRHTSEGGVAAHRRLQEVQSEGKADAVVDESEANRKKHATENEASDNHPVNVVGVEKNKLSDNNHGGDEDVEVKVKKIEEGKDEVADEDGNADSPPEKLEKPGLEADYPDMEPDEDEDEDMDELHHHFDHNGFGVHRPLDPRRGRDEKVEEEDTGDEGEDANDENTADSNEDVDNEERANKPASDPSSIDSWLAVLSSTDVRYFVRLIEAEHVGIVRLDG